MKLLIATNNINKKREIDEILGPLGFETVIPKELGVNFDPEETGSTFEENAMIKAQCGFALTGLGTIADDSGLCVKALDGRPGIYSARYGGEEVPYPEKIAKLQQEIGDAADRSASFECAIACVLSEDVSFTVTGRCLGEIAREAAGNGGFGYDPIFYIPSQEKTFSELTDDEKNAISHRGAALAALRMKLKEIQENK